MQFQPLYNRIVIDVIAEPEVSVGGIIIPNMAKDKPTFGKVVAVGQGLYNEAGVLEELLVKVDDTIMFTKNAGVEIKIDNKTYLLMKEDDVLGIVTE